MTLAVVEHCPDCGGRLAVRRNRRDRSAFIGCSRYPRCRYTENYCEREQRLLDRIADLQARIEQQDLLDRRDEFPLGDLDLARELRQLVARFHPDRHHGAQWAHEIVVELNGLRDRVRGRAA